MDICLYLLTPSFVLFAVWGRLTLWMIYINYKKYQSLLMLQCNVHRYIVTFEIDCYFICCNSVIMLRILYLKNKVGMYSIYAYFLFWSNAADNWLIFEIQNQIILNFWRAWLFFRNNNKKHCVDCEWIEVCCKVKNPKILTE